MKKDNKLPNKFTHYGVVRSINGITGECTYYVNGEKITEEEYKNKLSKRRGR